MSVPRRMHVPRRMNTPSRAGSMFPHTVTVYNIEVETDPNTMKSVVTNHITILRGVLVNASKGVNVRASGLESADAVTMYVPFSVEAVDGVTGKEKSYLPSIDFWRSEKKGDHWTFTISEKGLVGHGYTFFVKGEALPPEGTKPNLVADVVEGNFPDVYHITKIDTLDFGSPDMQHWEVGGV